VADPAGDDPYFVDAAALEAEEQSPELSDACLADAAKEAELGVVGDLAVALLRFGDASDEGDDAPLRRQRRHR
jgi:hypothetical protein